MMLFVILSNYVSFIINFFFVLHIFFLSAAYFPFTITISLSILLHPFLFPLNLVKLQLV